MSNISPLKCRQKNLDENYKQNNEELKTEKILLLEHGYYDMEIIRLINV